MQGLNALPPNSGAEGFSTTPDLQKYLKEAFFFDLKAGFITAIVALPLAIAFAIASGAPPIMGLYTAIIAGVLGSSFGGSKFSVTGPTGAMTVIILSAVNKFGIQGLLMAGFLAGVIQLAFGLMKIGQLVKFIPFPIVSGFTAGIGVIIFTGQVPSALGLKIPAKEFIGDTVLEILKHVGEINPLAIGVTLGTLFLLLFLPKVMHKAGPLKSLPPSMVALVLSTAVVFFLALPIPLVGDIPTGLPTFQLPPLDFHLAQEVLPSALTIALLGAIESLLCAVVADGMTNTQHDSDRELMGQGIANVIVPLLGGIPATAAVARTAVSIREGAKTRAAGVIHALILLLIVLFFGGLAKFIPRAFLAGILMFVALRMVDVDEFKTIMQISKSETLVLFATFGLTVFTNLVFAIQMGMTFAVFLLFIRLTKMAEVSTLEAYQGRNAKVAAMLEANPKLKDNVELYSINGPFFFGAMHVFDSRLGTHLDLQAPYIVLRLRNVPFIDSSGITRLTAFMEHAHKQGRTVLLAAVQPAVEERLQRSAEYRELAKPEHRFESADKALEWVEKRLGKPLPFLFHHDGDSPEEELGLS